MTVTLLWFVWCFHLHSAQPTLIPFVYQIFVKLIPTSIINKLAFPDGEIPPLETQHQFVIWELDLLKLFRKRLAVSDSPPHHMPTPSALMVPAATFATATSEDLWSSQTLTAEQHKLVSLRSTQFSDALLNGQAVSLAFHATWTGSAHPQMVKLKFVITSKLQHQIKYWKSSSVNLFPKSIILFVLFIGKIFKWE